MFTDKPFFREKLSSVVLTSRGVLFNECIQYSEILLVFKTLLGSPAHVDFCG